MFEIFEEKESQVRSYCRHFPVLLDKAVNAELFTADGKRYLDFLAGAGEGNSELMRWRKALAEQLNILPMGEYDGSPIYKIVFMCKEAKQLEPARQALEKNYNFVVQDVAAHSCLNGELINRKFDKGRGVRIIAEEFGADIVDTIGFGDSMNDLEMIETVGTSVCMDNGSPALKEKSDIICPAVEEDGLYRAFEQLGLI